MLEGTWWEMSGSQRMSRSVDFNWVSPSPFQGCHGAGATAARWYYQAHLWRQIRKQLQLEPLLFMQLFLV